MMSSARKSLFALALMLAPQAVHACFEMDGGLWFCAKGTEWADADSYKDPGVGSLILDEAWIAVFTDFTDYGPEGLSKSLEEHLEIVTAIDERESNLVIKEVYIADRLQLSNGTAARSIQRYRINDDETDSMAAVIMADFDDKRAMVVLDMDADPDWMRLDPESREMLDMIRTTCADPETCIDAATPIDAFKPRR